MLDEKKEVAKDLKTDQVKEAKKSVSKTKDYTVIKTITKEKVYNVGSVITLEVGSDLENELLTNKFINKHGISRSN